MLPGRFFSGETVSKDWWGCCARPGWFKPLFCMAGITWFMTCCIMSLIHQFFLETSKLCVADPKRSGWLSCSQGFWILKKNSFKTNGQPMGGHVLLLLFIIILLLTSQNRQGFPSFWIQMDTKNWHENQSNMAFFLKTISELYQNLRQGQKNGCWYIYIYIYISISSKRAFLTGSPSSSTWRQRRDWEV